MSDSPIFANVVAARWCVRADAAQQSPRWLRSLPVTAFIDELQQRLAIQGLSDVHEK